MTNKALGIHQIPQTSENVAKIKVLSDSDRQMSVQMIVRRCDLQN